MPAGCTISRTWLVPKGARDLLAVVCLTFTFVGITIAQFRFDSYTTENGLPQNGVRQIAQTNDGYLWFTTFDGLVRFDGIKFTVFDRSNTPEISSNRFTHLWHLPDDSLIAGTEDGGLTVFRDGTFRSVTVATGLPSNQIQNFGVDANGEFTILTAGGNAHLRNDQVVPFTDPPMPDNGFTYLSPSRTLWSYGNGQVRQVTSDGRQFAYPIKLDYFNERLSGVSKFEDSKGNLWFGDRSGLYILKDGNVRRLTETDGVPAGTLLRPFVEDNEGGIWCATGWGNLKRLGIVRYFDGKFSIWGKEAGLSDLNISQLFKDREGTIWVATDRGLNHLRSQMFQSYSTTDGLIHSEVYPLLRGRGGEIYVGTTRGVSVFRDGKLSTLDIKNENGEPVGASSLFEDEQRRLWIGGQIYDGKVIRPIAGLAGITVWAIFEDRKGYRWLGTGKGLFKLNGDQVIAKFTRADGLPSDDVSVIYEDTNGTLWLGTHGGIVRYDEQTFSVLTTQDGLASDRIRSIHQSADGTMWFGTYDGGLSRYADGKFVNFTIENGLFSNGVFAILEDRAANFWISCNRGIYRVKKSELDDVAAGQAQRIDSVAYGRSDGLLSTEANGGRQPAAITNSDGTMWFPTQDGVSVIDPARITANQNLPAVQIETISVDRIELDPRSDISLEADKQNLEIKFTGITFSEPEQVRFRYRIEGLSDTWTDVGTRRDVYFPSLPAGTYSFHVLAANSDGLWNETGAKIDIEVKAPFWRTSWFALTLGTVAVLIVFASFKLREKALERRTRVQREFSQRLIASQEGERKRIAAELHDSLGQYLLAIKNWAMFGLKSVPEDDVAREYLNEVSETSSLAINEVRQIAHDLRPYQLERLGLSNTLRQVLKNVETTSSIKFDYQIDEIDGVLSKENEIVLYRIVQECVSNVIKHSEATKATINVTATDQGAIFVCGDDGKGFDVEAAKGAASSGLGFESIVERSAILGGDLRIESDIGKGTKFTLSIPQA